MLQVNTKQTEKAVSEHIYVGVCARILVSYIIINTMNVSLFVCIYIWMYVCMYAPTYVRIYVCI